MSKLTKRQKAIAAKVEEGKVYSIEEAVAVLAEVSTVKFKEALDVSINLGIDAKKSDQQVRGATTLPHGSGKEVRVLVFAKGDAAIAAEKAGAEHVGFEDLLKKVQGGFIDFDVAVATPDAMAEVRKLGRVLGPRGLMPNPKTGTVTDDTAAAVKAVKAGRVDFKLDKNANISVPIGKASFTEAQLSENAAAVIDSVQRARPATAKGRYILAATMAATMSPGVSLQPSLYFVS